MTNYYGTAILGMVLVTLALVMCMTADRYFDCRTGSYRMNLGSDSYDCVCRAAIDFHPLCEKEKH